MTPLSTVRKRVRSHAKKVLVPHKDNQYRPHLIRAHGLIAVLIVALIAQVAYSVITTGKVSVLGQASTIAVTELINDTNAVRTQQGVAALQQNDQLTQAAFLKAKNMFAEQYWAHESPSGIQPWKWFADAGYNYSYAGENLAKNYPTAQATVDAWMNSPTHRQNMLNGQYVDVGFAVVDGTLNGQATTLVVAFYGAPATVAVRTEVRNQASVEATPANFNSAAVVGAATSPLQYFGSAVSTMSPVTLAILGLLAVVAIVGVAAHHYRARLPKAWRKSWRVHHGLYTFVGMIALGVLIIVATGGGSL